MKILRNLQFLLDKRLVRASRVNQKSCRLCCQTAPVTATRQYKHVELLSDLTGCSPRNVIKALSEAPGIQLLNEAEVAERFRRIKELNVSERHGRHIMLTALNPLTVTNRVYSLIELGFTSRRITVAPVRNYVKIARSSVIKLKKKQCIEENTDVIRRLATYARIEPESLPESLNENCSVDQIKMAVHKELLKKRLEVSEEEVSNAKITLKSILHRSVRMILKNIDVFENVLKLPKKRILRSFFMITADPEKTVRCVNEVESIGGVDILDLIYMCPQIAIMSPENTRAIIRHFKDYGAPEDFLVKSPTIFTLSESTVKDRLDQLKRNKYFGCYRKHPRIVHIVQHFLVISKALETLEKSNLKISSINNMHCRKSFEKYINEGWKKANGVDLLYFLYGEFGKPVREIRTYLNAVNRHWYHASIMDVFRNFMFLQTFFSLDDIWKSLFVLFYPHGKVRDELEQLDSQTSEYLESLQDETGRIRHENRLPLLLYYLERYDNFTGEGIYLMENSDDLIVDDPRQAVNSV